MHVALHDESVCDCMNSLKNLPATYLDTLNASAHKRAVTPMWSMFAFLYTLYQVGE